MKNLLLLTSATALALLPLATQAQTPDTLLAAYERVSGTQTARLSLFKYGSFLLGGEYDGGNSFSIPAEGGGTRLMWYPSRAAFRAGYVNGTQWDDANIGLYSMALGYNVRASGDYTFASGNSTVAAQIGSTAMGQYCTASGAASVALGNYAHTNARQGSFVFADRSVTDDGNSSTDESFRGPVNHAAYWRVTGGFRVVTGGTPGTFDYTPNRGVSILSGTTNTTTDWGQPTALIATSSGAYLSSGGTWTNSSDRRKKHLFEPVAGEDVLARLRGLPMQRWTYKTEPASVRHLGPMAQDFRAAFGLGPDSISIATVDADGVALAGVQALEARTRTQAAQLTALQTDNAALRARLDALERRAAAPVANTAATAALPLAGLLLALLLGWWYRQRRPVAA
jgi:hypothetical protein